MKIPVVIIGGGIAGVYIACKLNFPCLLLESQAQVGGRIKTIGENGLVSVEGGPWRIHHSHKRILSLLNHFQLNLKQTTSSLEGGFSTFDKNILEKGIAEARKKDILSGYVGLSEATSAANVYHAQRHQQGAYYVVREGLQALVDKLEMECTKKHATIWTNTKVTDISKTSKNTYEISAIQRQKDTFTPLHIEAALVILACPPNAVSSWDIAHYLLPQIHAVKSHPLHHIYVSGKIKNQHRKVSGVLSQIISGDYNQQFFQGSYSAGRIATFWQRLKLNDPKAFKRLLFDELKKEGIEADANAEIKSYFWKNVVHYWIPMFGTPSIKKLVTQSIVPNPVKLPNLYWCGEAFSGYQGWIEGALQTADMVLEQMCKKNHCFRKVPQHAVLLDNRVLDVRKWKNVHPGSSAAIEKRMGQDISSVFRHINHTDESWATVYALQMGFYCP